MNVRFVVILIGIFLTTSCLGQSQYMGEPAEIESPASFDYQIGLGYGFQGKEVKVIIDGVKAISLIGTEEIEQYAQLKGTKMLASGASLQKKLLVRVIIDGGMPHEQIIDISEGSYVHIYLEPGGLRVYNTIYLVLE